MPKYYLICIVLCLNIFGCKQSNPPSTIGQSNYFDLAHYVDSLIVHTDTIRSVTKSIHLNDLTESKQIEGYNIKNDLLDIAKKSIAHPKFIGKYSEGKRTTDTRQSIITYTALDDDLPIRLMIITRNYQNQIESIGIHEKKETAIIKQQVTHTLNPATGYSKSSCDSLALMGKKCKGLTIDYK